MNDEIRRKAEVWTQPPFDEKTRDEIRGLLESGDDSGLADRFYKDLEFGTGGMRGIMGAGTNRMNTYTIGKATQGLADYLRARSGATETVKTDLPFLHRGWQDWETISVEVAIPEPFLLHSGFYGRIGFDLSECFDLLLSICCIDLYDDAAYTWSGELKY